MTTTTYEAGEIAPVTIRTRSKAPYMIVACYHSGGAVRAGYAYNPNTAHTRARREDAKSPLGTVHLVLPIADGKVEVPGRARLPLSCGHVTVPLFAPEAATARRESNVWCRDCGTTVHVEVPAGTAPCGQAWGHDAHVLTTPAPGAASKVFYCDGYPDECVICPPGQCPGAGCPGRKDGEEEPADGSASADLSEPVDTSVWEPVPGQPGCVRKVGQRWISAVFADLKARLGETGPGHNEYFTVTMGADGRRRYGELWPEGTPIVFTRNGNSEGHITQVAVVSDGGTVFDVVLMAKTFDGADEAWAFGRRLAEALGVIW